MAIAMLSWLLAIPLLGLSTGLRSLTPIAVMSWFAYTGNLSLDGSWAQWLGHLTVAIVLTALALGELVADKFPWIPARVSPVPLLWRLVLGAVTGSIAAASIQGAGLEGGLLGVLGAVLGTFGGYMVRRDLTEKFQCADWVVAVAEDLLAIGFAVYAMQVVTE